MVTSYFDPATKLIYAAGALCGLIGAIKVYSKFSSGDPDTGVRKSTRLNSSHVFLIVAATVLRAFFL